MATSSHFSDHPDMPESYISRRERCYFLLHRVNIMDSAVWSFLYVLILFTVHTVSSTSTVSISKFVLIEPKRKSQMGLILHAISLMVTFNFKHFLFENLLMLMKTNPSLVLTLDGRIMAGSPSCVLLQIYLKIL